MHACARTHECRYRYRFEGIEVGDSVHGASVIGNTVTGVQFGYGVYFGGGNTASTGSG